MTLAPPSKTEVSDYHHFDGIARSEPASKGFSGEVRCHDISKIIQSLSLAKLDIALVIENGPKDGKIIFKDGERMTWICGDVTGKDAISEIKSWKEGAFTLLRIFDGIVCRDE